MLQVNDRKPAAGAVGAPGHGEFERALQEVVRARYPRRIFSAEEQVVWAAAAQEFRERNGRLPNPRRPHELTALDASSTRMRERLYDLSQLNPMLVPGSLA